MFHMSFKDTSSDSMMVVGLLPNKSVCMPISSNKQPSHLPVEPMALSNATPLFQISPSPDELPPPF